QQTSLPQQPSSILIRQRHAPEVAPANIWNSVVPGQTLIDEGIVRAEQVQHTVILAQAAFKEQLCLPLERFAQIVIEIGKLIRVGGERPNAAQQEPLSGEIVYQRLGARIGQHPPYLLLQHLATAQPPASGQIEKLF